jgi:uncharacterized protein YlbG (UPF0298 family)
LRDNRNPIAFIVGNLARMIFARNVRQSMMREIKNNYLTIKE